MIEHFPIGCSLGKNIEGDTDKDEDKDSLDRISDLPDSVIHQILSSFDMKDVFQTSILSKRWRYVWKSHPFLNFNSDLLFPKDNVLFPKIWYLNSGYKHLFSERRRKCKGFFDFVDKIIRFRDNDSNIQSFHLNNQHHLNPGSYNFKKWILIALRSNVEDLSLSIRGQDFFNQLPLECLFTCKSLTKLELRNNNGNDIAVPNLPYFFSIDLPKLKSLLLQGFMFKYSEFVANNIFSTRCFPVLESLILLGCAFHESRGINISATQLKHLVIVNNFHKYKYPIKLCAPNLIKFVCKDRFLSRDYLIENLPAIEEAEIGLGTDESYLDKVPHFDDIEEGRLYSQLMMKFLSAVHNVETLTLRAPFLKSVSGDNAVLESTSIRFCNLRCLKLETWLSVDCVNSITYLLNISPNVESLFLDILREDRKGNSVVVNSVLDEVHWEAGLSLHRLKNVEIQGALGYEDELRFLEILLKKAMVLENVTLYAPKKKQSSYSITITKEQLEKTVEQLVALPKAASSVTFRVV